MIFREIIELIEIMKLIGLNGVVDVYGNGLFEVECSDT